MILCLDMKDLDRTPSVQKNINLEELLLNHTKYYEESKDALKDNYLPLSITLIVRTAYTNLVLKVADNCSVTNHNLFETPHKGYDNIMFHSGNIISSLCDTSKEDFFEIMMKSQFQVLGLQIVDDLFKSPSVLVQVVIPDYMTVRFIQTLKDTNNHLIPIEEAKYTKELKDVVNELIIVRSESDAPCT